MSDSASKARTTTVLLLARQGDTLATSRLMELVYDELRELAAQFFRRENPGHTLQPTAVVHEAYLRLIDQEGADWKSKTHFFAIAATMMRRVLVDHWRGKAAQRRLPAWARVGLEGLMVRGQSRTVDLIELDDALARLASLEPRQSRVVELRFFGGLTVAQVAQTLDVSPSTVEADWRMARAWLHRELERSKN